MVPDRKFWMVFGPANGPTSHQHPTLEAAETEAKRLAQKCPGSPFIVLEAVTAIVKREFDTITLRAPTETEDHDDDIPF